MSKKHKPHKAHKRRIPNIWDKETLSVKLGDTPYPEVKQSIYEDMGIPELKRLVRSINHQQRALFRANTGLEDWDKSPLDNSVTITVHRERLFQDKLVIKRIIRAREAKYDTTLKMVDSRFN